MHKQIQWAATVLLTLVSPALFALGLGGASVDSYLNQPLDVRVELISQSRDELLSITAGLASAGDFELIGLSRSAITVPLEFEVVSDSNEPYIRITSRLAVNEPVVQIVVEVAWTRGRMLREYTLFLDPPTFDSAAPPAVVKPAPLPAVVEESPFESKPAIIEPEVQAPEPEVQAPEPEAQAPEPVAQEPEPVAQEPEPVAQEPEPVTQEPESVTEEPAPATEAPESEAQEPDMDVGQPVAADGEDSGSEEIVAETADETADSSTDEFRDESGDEPADQAIDDFVDGEVYGPVASGQTLWGISREWSRETGYSINQTMLALQRKNPDAFFRDNINALKRGAILRLPTYSEVYELTSREAMVEVLRQDEVSLVGKSTLAPEFGTPTVADSGDYQESVIEAVPEAEIEEDAGHLELVPPVETDDTAGQVPGREPADEFVQEELTRTEEELANAQQENIYLQDQIDELEAQQQEKALEITDPGLAGVESSLAEKRAEDKPEPPVALTPGGEEQPWYAGGSAWIVGIALVLIAFTIWLLRRRSAGQAEVQRAEEKSEAVQAVTEEAEDLLGILDRYEDETVTKVAPIAGPETEPELETTDQDPEVELDLARAYLSLGDKEAARSMLEEVLSNGNEAQRAEAMKMMEEL